MSDHSQGFFSRKYFRSPLFIGLLLAAGGALLALRALAAAPAGPVLPPSTHPDRDRRYQKSCAAEGCHALEAPRGGPKHPPYLEGRCLTCHTDHATSGTALLKRRDNTMCLQCHTNLETDSTTLHTAHPPGGGNCTDCHNPHQSRLRNLLRDNSRLLSCSQCHASFLKQAAAYPYRHQYFNPRTECGYCHYAHKRRAHHYLRENVAESCLTCHDLPIQTRGRPLENVAQRLREAPFVHGTMKIESCPACHTPHGSNQPSLLQAGYPAGSYKTYQSDHYSLCWHCHDKSLVEAPHDPTATKFRSGGENLHWLHVVRMKRGRACHLCHEAHASDRPHLLRERVQFGQWNAPLVHRPLPDGGSCQTPCHREKQYLRGEKKTGQTPPQ